MANTTILVVGAGPTGLALALSLVRQGITPRIIDQNDGPGLASRAMVVHARTLELYHQLGVGDEMAAQGVPVETARIFARGHEVAKVNFKNIGEGLSPYPYVLAYPQDDHERFLVKKLEDLGIRVEWGTQLRNFTQNESQVSTTLTGKHPEEKVTFDYVCGCDGAHSRVRETLGLKFSGGTYSQLFFVADVKIAGDFDKEFKISLGTEDFGLMLPVRSSGMQRLIGLVPSKSITKENLNFEDVRARFEHLLQIQVSEVNWFSSYHTHHRVAEKFRIGRCFLLGDAGHIHSPAGGQGMNTGIGDAVNLGWKLAEVVSGQVDTKILDSFETERMAFARSLVATTDRGFRLIVGQDWGNQILRLFLAPELMKFMWNMRGTRRLMFKIISQIHIQYRKSVLSMGHSGRLRGGDRLPWMHNSDIDNFTPLISINWQVHVYGKLDPQLSQTRERLRLPIHSFNWSSQARKAGFHRDVAYLIRPDSYIALILNTRQTELLLRYVDEFKLRFGRVNQ